MQIETVDINSIQPDPANVRRHPVRNLTQIKGSLARFGQQKPVVVDHRNVVIAGNGTLQAAKELGWSTIQIVRTGLAGVEATAFAIADNRSAEGAEWDETALSDVLTALGNEDAGLVSAAGFTAEDVASLCGGGPDDPAGQTTGEDPGEGRYEEQHAVIVTCKDAAHQEQVYNTLVAQGYTCRVVST